METIWKFPLRITDEQTLNLPASAELLSVQVQDDAPCLWVRLDPAAAVLPRRIVIHGTGHSVPPSTGRHLGTCQFRGGALVFHVFEGN